PAASAVAQDVPLNLCNACAGPVQTTVPRGCGFLSGSLSSRLVPSGMRVIRLNSAPWVPRVPISTNAVPANPALLMTWRTLTLGAASFEVAVRNLHSDGAFGCRFSSESLEHRSAAVTMAYVVGG